MKKINMDSKGCKILSLWMINLTIVISGVLIYYANYSNIKFYLFLLFLYVFLGYGFFACCYARIIIKNNKITFYYFSWFRPQKYSCIFDDIDKLSLDEKIGEINVITLVTHEKVLKFAGYNSFKGLKHSIEKSRYIIENINSMISNYNKK